MPLELFQMLVKLQSLNLFLRKADSSNYTPISLLPLISKILERVIHDQKNALLKEKLPYSNQSGFRANQSTNLYFSFSTDKILKGFDMGLLTKTILIDLHKHLTQLIMKFFLKIP